MSSRSRFVFMFFVFIMLYCQTSNQTLTNEKREEIEAEIKKIGEMIDQAWIEHDADKMMSYFFKSEDLTKLSIKVNFTKLLI